MNRPSGRVALEAQDVSGRSASSRWCRISAPSSIAARRRPGRAQRRRQDHDVEGAAVGDAEPDPSPLISTPGRCAETTVSIGYFAQDHTGVIQRA
jgi:hypothetical protein